MSLQMEGGVDLPAHRDAPSSPLAPAVQRLWLVHVLYVLVKNGVVVVVFALSVQKDGADRRTEMETPPARRLKRLRALGCVT